MRWFNYKVWDGRQIQYVEVYSSEDQDIIWYQFTVVAEIGDENIREIIRSKFLEDYGYELDEDYELIKE